MGILRNLIWMRRNSQASLILLYPIKIILVVRQFFAFLRSQGHERPICDACAMSAYPSTPDVMLSAAKRRSGPLTSDLRLDAPQQSLLRYSMRPAAAI
jgi:hypothetical protein